MKLLKLFVMLIPVIFLISGCEDRNELTAPIQNPVSGNADFTKFAAVGNSLVAGVQSNSLYESAQEYSLSNLIARQTSASFVQPLISEPGIGKRIEIQSLSPFVLKQNQSQGTPLNLGYAAPYNNLGVPGAILYDFLNASSSTTCGSYVFAGVLNPYFDIVLRNIGTQYQQLKALQPTFILFWMGNNDVLGFATSGGVSPSTPTPDFLFEALYNASADSLASLGADVVVGNIPDVSIVPFFNTVGPTVALSTPWTSAGLPGIFYQSHGEVGPASLVADSISLLRGIALLTLPGSNYAVLLGTPTGKFYRDNNYPGIPAGIDTTKPFGFHPQNPWPDALILDEGEILTVRRAVDNYNDIIDAAAADKGFIVADVHSEFNNIRLADFSGGTVFNGVTFTTTFVQGGLFSLDGAHPSSRGCGVLANIFLKAINTGMGSNFPLVDVSKIPGSLKFTGKGIMKLPYFSGGLKELWF